MRHTRETKRTVRDGAARSQWPLLGCHNDMRTVAFVPRTAAVISEFD